MATIVSDAFDRADSTTTLGNADTGQTWVPYVPISGTASVFGIKSNQAALEVNNAANRNVAVIDAGVADCSVSAVVANVSTAGIAVRMSPSVFGGVSYNGFMHNNTTLYRADNGTLTAILTLSSALANGDTVMITMVGSLLTVYKNGTSVGSVTDTHYQTQTQHGLRATNPSLNVGLWNNFLVTSPTALGVRRSGAWQAGAVKVRRSSAWVAPTSVKVRRSGVWVPET